MDSDDLQSALDKVARTTRAMRLLEVVQGIIEDEYLRYIKEQRDKK